MGRIFITLTFVLTILPLVAGKAIAREEKFFDFFGDIVYGEECLRSWQIEEASAVAEKLLSVGVDTTELLANKLNHPAREFHYYMAIKLLETILL